MRLWPATLYGLASAENTLGLGLSVLDTHREPSQTELDHDADHIPLVGPDLLFLRLKAFFTLPEDRVGLT